TAAMLLLAPAAASAADYCVGSPAGCVGTDEASNLQKALDDAKAHAGGDRVLIGPGGAPHSKTDGFPYSSIHSANTGDVIGVGSPAPTVTMTTSGSTMFVLSVQNNGSTVSNLRIAVPDEGTDTAGLKLGNGETATGLEVTGDPSPAPFQTGINMGASTLRDSTIN